jgi:transcriptional regulator with XRE-family HTH domain
MSTLGERIKIVQIKSGLQQPQFAKILGVSKETLIHYQKDRRHPVSVFLSNLCKIYRVNPTWLLMGEGEPFIGKRIREEESAKQSKVPAIGPVMQLLNEEEERAGVTLTPEQRTAILKILRELVDRDVRSIRELLRSIPGGKKKGDE